MKIENSIREKIERLIQPHYFELENESRKHSVPPNSETHFRILLVASFFENMSRVERARTMHELLSDELSGGVHALSERMFTPSEWQKLSDQQKLMISPLCLGAKIPDAKIPGTNTK
jgi:stress-induced morphogen